MKTHKCFKCQKPIQRKPVYGLHATCFQKWFNISKFTSFSNLDPKKPASINISSHNLNRTKNSFYHGRYRKYSAKLGDQQYILKVEELGFPDLPAMEYLCNQIATHLGLKVPEYYLIQFNDTSYLFDRSTNHKHRQKPQRLMAFVTKNFMQNYIGSLHHIYKFLPKGNKDYNCQNIIKVIIAETKQPAEVEKFLKICLFDSFIGNNDRHGRNLGIIDKGKKKILAPMYDNPSLLAVEKKEMLDFQFNISGCIWTTSSKEPKLKDYVQEFKNLGKVRFDRYLVQDRDIALKKHKAKKEKSAKINIKYKATCFKFMKKIITKFPEIIKEVKCAEISENRKKAFIRFLSDRLKDLEQILKEDNKNA